MERRTGPRAEPCGTPLGPNEQLWDFHQINMQFLFFLYLNDHAAQLFLAVMTFERD